MCWIFQVLQIASVSKFRINDFDAFFYSFSLVFEIIEKYARVYKYYQLNAICCRKPITTCKSTPSGTNFVYRHKITEKRNASLQDQYADTLPRSYNPKWGGFKQFFPIRIKNIPTVVKYSIYVYVSMEKLLYANICILNKYTCESFVILVVTIFSIYFFAFDFRRNFDVSMSFHIAKSYKILYYAFTLSMLLIKYLIYFSLYICMYEIEFRTYVL